MLTLADFASWWSTYMWHPLEGLGYQFWSGVGSDIGEVTLIGAMIVAYRKINCHEPQCWRIGKHRVDGTPYVTCHRHHPGLTGDHVQPGHIEAAHYRAQAVESKAQSAPAPSKRPGA